MVAAALGGPCWQLGALRAASPSSTRLEALVPSRDSTKIFTVLDLVYFILSIFNSVSSWGKLVHTEETHLVLSSRLAEILLLLFHGHSLPSELLRFMQSSGLRKMGSRYRPLE